MGLAQQIVATYAPPSNGMFNGLIHYYKLDESSGIANDSIGTVNLNPVATISYSAGLLNNAVKTGSGNLSSSGNDMGLNASAQPFTFAFWIKPTSTIVAQQVFFDITDATTHNNIALDWFTGSARLIRTKLGIISDIASTAQTFTGGVWYCIVCKYDGATLSLRINNGTASTVASTGDGSSGGTDGFCLGAYTNNGTRFVGQTDEFGIWNRAITSGQETTFYNSGAPFPLPNYS